MKILFLNAAKFFQKDSDRYRIGVDPRADWRIILTALIIVLITAIAYGVYRYQGVARWQFTEQVPPSSARALLDENLLKKTVNELRRKETQFNDMRNNNPRRFVDPSL